MGRLLSIWSLPQAGQRLRLLLWTILVALVSALISLGPVHQGQSSAHADVFDLLHACLNAPQPKLQREPRFELQTNTTLDLPFRLASLAPAQTQTALLLNDTTLQPLRIETMRWPKDPRVPKWASPSTLPNSAARGEEETLVWGGRVKVPVSAQQSAYLYLSTDSQRRRWPFWRRVLYESPSSIPHKDVRYVHLESLYMRVRLPQTLLEELLVRNNTNNSTFQGESDATFGGDVSLFIEPSYVVDVEPSYADDTDYVKDITARFPLSYELIVIRVSIVQMNPGAECAAPESEGLQIRYVLYPLVMGLFSFVTLNVWIVCFVLARRNYRLNYGLPPTFFGSRVEYRGW